MLSLYGRKLRTLGIAVETRYDADVPVTAFPGELRQVFSNLIVNAADALEKSGDKLCIHVFESLDWTNLTQRGLRITISDNGCGIPVEKRAQMFEPFYTTKGSKGTGIGLWVSLGIVKKYGGTIRFRSSVKQGRSGTTFSIFLPVAQSVLEQPSVIVSASGQIHEMHELGIDRCSGIERRRSGMACLGGYNSRGRAENQTAPRLSLPNRLGVGV